MDVPGPLPVVGAPPLAFRFSVLFLRVGVVPNPIDTLFQSVSGLGASMATTSLEEGGHSLSPRPLPRKIEHDNLVLERGMIVGSALTLELNAAMSPFKFRPANVLVSLLDNTRAPLASWLCVKAYPVKWSVSDLGATSNSVVIERIELAYQRLQTIRL